MGQKKVAIVERFKQESMYGLSAKKSGRCREVAVSGGAIPFNLLQLFPSLLPFFFFICSVFYAPFSCSEQFKFTYATQLASFYYDNFRDTAPVI